MHPYIVDCPLELNNYFIINIFHFLIHKTTIYTASNDKVRYKIQEMSNPIEDPFSVVQG